VTRRVVLMLLALGCGEEEPTLSHESPDVVEVAEECTGAVDRAVVVEPSDIDMGRVEVGDSSEVTVMIGNAGCGVLRLDNLSANTTTGTESSVTVGHLGAVILPGGASTSFQLVFTPEAAEYVEGTVLVESDDPVHPEFRAEYWGEGR
jgi:hypothetical protein